MLKRVISLTTVILLIATLYINAQTVNTAYGGTVITDLMLSEALINSGETTIKYQFIEGTPYYSEEFAPAEIHMRNGYVQKNIYARLDLFEGNVEVKVNGEALVMSSPQVISKVVINSESFIYLSENKHSEPKGFYKVYHMGDSKVFGYEEVIFKAEETAINSYSEDKPDRFSHLRERMFIMFDAGQIFEVTSKKKFINEMEVSKPEIYNYIKENKLNPTNTSDLIELAKEFDNSSI